MDKKFETGKLGLPPKGTVQKDDEKDVDRVVAKLHERSLDLVERTVRVNVDVPVSLHTAIREHVSSLRPKKTLSEYFIDLAKKDLKWKDPI